MNESSIATEVHEWWKGERRFLPISAAIATAVCLAVWIWRLDQAESPFLIGVLVGALLTVVLYGCVIVINLGAVLRGAPRNSSLFRKALWLIHAR